MAVPVWVQAATGDLPRLIDGVAPVEFPTGAANKEVVKIVYHALLPKEGDTVPAARGEGRADDLASVVDTSRVSPGPPKGTEVAQGVGRDGACRGRDKADCHEKTEGCDDLSAHGLIPQSSVSQNPP